MTTYDPNTIVYQRKGTSILIPETEANKKDPNLVPMSVGEAIKLGYIDDPDKDSTAVIVSDSRVTEENKRLKQQISDMKAQGAQQDKILQHMQSQLNNLAPVNPTSIPVVGLTVQEEDLIKPSEVTEDGHDDTASQLYQLLGK